MFWTKASAAGGAVWLTYCQPLAMLAACVCAVATFKAWEALAPKVATRLRRAR
jgi:hypothetical protein